MVISRLVVDTAKQQTLQVCKDLEALPGVEVHEQVETRLVVTIEAETSDESHAIASGFYQIEGVVAVSLVYVNFEDDPSLGNTEAGELGEEFQE